MAYWNRKFFAISVLLCLNFCSLIAFEQFIDQIQRISWLDCKNRCNEEANCLSVRYLRRFYLCKMYGILLKTEAKEQGTKVYLKSKSKSEFGCDNIDQEVEFHKKVCPVPKVDRANMDGNLFHIGSKVKFTCPETGRWETVQCLSDGSWSANTLFCTPQLYSACEYPGTLLHGQLGTLSAFNASHGILNVSCDIDYSLISHGNILCEIARGLWSGFENFCCDKLTISSWTKLYSSPKGLSQGIMHLYNGKVKNINTCTSGFYRNAKVFINWANTGIAFVNFTVMSDGTAVAYMLFNGTGTDMTSWFSIGNLLQSSWSDLKSTTEVQSFSFVGMNKGGRRWFVAQDIRTVNLILGMFKNWESLSSVSLFYKYTIKC